ncbi:magnesium chelatase subunit D [Falsiroseomonas ponticola]|uniref:magnesium chelatase subunit D n=1 Tax=Falsiroseomonas ponticola TaxID=2786951 RepID=UPI001931621F|nr:magnesium chelatase subunit D [Roseomonas ponticola]
MTEAAGHPPAEDAARAALLLAVDPAGLGGAALRCAPGFPRDRWLGLLRVALPEGAPLKRLPTGVPDSRLLGGLDLTATLSAGRPVVERGVLADAHGGLVLAAMAERMDSATAAKIAAVLDAGQVAVQRDGLGITLPARIGLVALDEGASEEEQPPPALLERLAFRLFLDELPQQAVLRWPVPDRAAIAAARARLARVTVPEATLEALVAAALAFGIDSARAPLLALRAARAAAALAGRDTVGPEEAGLAARLVYGHRATRLPAAEEAPPEPPPSDPPPHDENSADQKPEGGPDPQALQEMLLAATQAALPAGLLAALGADARNAARRSAGAQGREGQRRQSRLRGRPIGTRAGTLRDGARLSIVETLRSAAPWQPLRLRERAGRPGPRILVKRDDIRLMRFQQNTETTAIFVVDASGSAALHRLAEAKGAVEMLLADCYVRRDRVAVVAFRGQAAELLLPPTNSLVRAKRSLAGLPGGGATPLALGLDAAMALAEEERRRGRTPLVILLTDGRANISRAGTPGRPQAEADALSAAVPFRLAGLSTLLVDTAPRPAPFAKQMATAMGAKYLALPAANSEKLSAAVTATRGAA